MPKAKSPARAKSAAATKAAVATEFTAPIVVPLPEAGSYKPDRAAGKLLQAQTFHLREALLKHLADLAAIVEIDPRSLKTEGEVSAYIRRATAMLHTHHSRAARK